MPTYEYACLSCGTHVDVVQRFDDEPLTECGLCGGRLRKVFHPAGILFKGSGFYATDSRSSRRDGSKVSGDGARSGGDRAKESTAASSGSSTTSSSASSSSAGKESA